VKEQRQGSLSGWTSRLQSYLLAAVMAGIATALKVALGAYIVPTFILASPCSWPWASS
jgi:hypothetical protein